MKTILKILLILGVGVYLVVVLGFTGRKYDSVLCRGLEVVIRDSLDRGLITSADIRSLVNLEHPGIAGLPLPEVDLSGIEESLNSVPAISGAQVYTNVGGQLVVEISQREPVVRVEDLEHRHYFLDAGGYVIPATMDFNPRILIANGHIPGKYRRQEKLMLPAGAEGQAGISGTDRMMEGLLNISTYIHEDPFWRSQIVQLYVNEKDEFELVPRVGPHIILFGDDGRLEYKFFKLETLYREGFSRTGWNQYELINLKYNNQVICTKR